MGEQGGEMAAVLVVDDYDAGGELLARLLRRRGHEAKHVASGREALGAMSESRYDLVVLDYMMPGMDGADVLRAMAGHPTTAAVPVVVLTAAADPAVDHRVRRLGARDCVLKGTGWGELYSRLQPFLGTAPDFSSSPA
jgi:CheY-like chemotaxis protein